MSEQQVQSREQDQLLTPRDVQAVNDRNRKAATRPGWIAGLAFLVFMGGLAAFMFSF
jgi:hypothetical protein